MSEASSSDQTQEAGHSTPAVRQPHAVLDLPSRRFKGLKIERLLDLANRAQPIRMLEVGTGSGGIAHYFGTHPQLRCEVDAVDVHDNRLVAEGYRYHQVHDTGLPFANQSFDVVLSNHVIEHVGDEQAQRAHLAELRRVVRSDGVGYLAVPNRWMLVEPHYKLVFLSWLPHAWRTQYLRAMGKGEIYDCEPLRLGQLEKLLADAGFRYRNLCVDALRATFEIERPQSAATSVLRSIPDGLLMPWRRIIPTLIYRFWL
ncbi:MAG: class I SAM-dependent methyltransferase [Rhodanobacter sp.]|uniref:class I SAM-dependent methyltransferase n=2 Tax=Rhodanobacter TaxID=75309 RepID=UPI0009DC155D|nr:class I SAM-dependent methyltransferase [Rhodanobacter thiooxydans]TAN18160.1 MAG: class I SAM-dependent methyltransferase [Rhodanobacter sp.]UJJ55928.1 class I SAM-dependent methyltransferase [Rhodanobacter thiooxydans]